MSLRVVFDTNVLFSALGWGGTPGECVEYASAGRIRGVTCVEIIEELAERLEVKLGWGNEEVDAVLVALLSFFEVVTISGAMAGLQADPKDDKILECSVVGNATHIVTGDRKHLLPVGKFGNVEIVTPRRLVEVVAQAPV